MACALDSYVTMVICQYGGLLAVRNRRVSILQSNPLWGSRRNLVILAGMAGTALVAIVNLYGPGLQHVFGTAPIPGMFWGIPFAFAAGILLLDEIRKALVRSYPKVSLSSIYQKPYQCSPAVIHSQDGLVRQGLSEQCTLHTEQ